MKNGLPAAWVFSLATIGTDVFAGQWANSVYKNTNLLSAIHEENTGKFEVNIYPNPSNGVFTVTIPSSSIKVNIEIYNTFGEIICLENNKSVNSGIKNKINLDAPSGIYLIKINDGESQFTGKIIIN